MTYPKDRIDKSGPGGGEGSVSVGSQISAALSNYVTSASVSAMVAGYLTSASANLAQYLTSASAASVYVTSNSVSGMIASQLTPYITSASVATALTPYLTSASAAGVYISSNSVSGMITTRLAPYLTSASAALSTYVTSGSLATALGPYLTSASANLGTYVTSGSLATALGTYVTSGSLATALTPYLTSASAAAAYVTSQSVSVMIAAQLAAAPPGSGETSASISLMIASRLGGLYTATASLAAVTVAGRPVGSVLLGYQTISNVNNFSFSGSWSDFCVLQLSAAYRIETGTSATASAAIYTDGGTTPFLGLGSVSSTQSAGQLITVELAVYGGDGRPNKLMRVDTAKATNLITFAATATANTGFVNAIKYFTSATMTAGMAVLFGWRKA